LIGCAGSWVDIALYGRNKLPWLKTFLDLRNGIPSHDIMPIDPATFETAFLSWVGTLARDFDSEVMAM
jgi:hypothetical protein